MRYIIFITCFFFKLQLYSHSSIVTVSFIDSTYNIIAIEQVPSDTLKSFSSISKLFHHKKQNNKRIIAAILAFPFPFGIVGLHRIFLGTKPYVPVSYIASFGGVFGVLPLIDFFTIIFHKEFEQLENNGRVFLWIKD
ncbi:MAG: hypothetical protein IT237_10765 [Bacteroidia bacterium]|nr:hypothetical protein [Bacteroidia bacterium]